MAEFLGPHDKLSFRVVEHFLIGTIYGPFSLTNQNLGEALFDRGQSPMRWLCQPEPVRRTPEYVQRWVNAAAQLVEKGKIGQTREADLTWMRVKPYVPPIRAQFAELEVAQLDLIDAGNNGKEVSIEWNVRGAPVRIQLVFSRRNTTVHFNLRPRASSWRSIPSAVAHQANTAFINARFGPAPDCLTRISNAGDRDCFFKPFAVGRVDASFDYTDPTSAVLVKSLHANHPPLELNFQGAMTHLLAALLQPPDPD